MEKKNDGFLSFAVIGAAIILYARTADVLSYFSPSILNDILGWDVSLVYGLVTAFMVEGVALALHFNRRAALSGTAQLVKWTLLGISGVCQVFDGYVITNTLANQTDTIKAVFQYGVPLIPLLIMIMIFGIGHLPESNEQRKPFKGVRNVLPDWEKLWYGPNGKPARKPQAQPIANALAIDTKRIELEKIQEPDPTNRRNGS